MDLIEYKDLKLIFDNKDDEQFKNVIHKIIDDTNHFYNTIKSDHKTLIQQFKHFITTTKLNIPRTIYKQFITKPCSFYGYKNDIAFYITHHKLMHQYFPELKPYFEAEGFHVYNCNPDSELKVFDYVPYEEAISFATSSLGEVDNERTWGMYSKPDERQKWAIEPDDRNKAHLNNISNRM